MISGVERLDHFRNPWNVSGVIILHEGGMAQQHLDKFGLVKQRIFDVSLVENAKRLWERFIVIPRVPRFFQEKMFFDV